MGEFNWHESRGDNYFLWWCTEGRSGDLDIAGSGGYGPPPGGGWVVGAERVTGSSAMLLHPSKACVQVTTFGFLDLGDWVTFIWEENLKILSFSCLTKMKLVKIVAITVSISEFFLEGWTHRASHQILYIRWLVYVWVSQPRATGIRGWVSSAGGSHPVRCGMFTHW